MSVTFLTNEDKNEILQIVDDKTSSTNHNICTFLDAYTAWCNGESFPIAFYGDSTFAGHLIERDRAFSAKLQALLREECGGSVQVYNVGYSGEDLNFALEKFDEFFGEESVYANTKMVGIGFGINDRLSYSTYKAYKNGVYGKYETLIKKCFSRGIQPFLVTSQAILQCGVGTAYTNYVLRDSNSINVCANGVKKELALKYGIPLIDLGKATELFLTNSSVAATTIIPDNIHFGDIGHQFEAGYLFSKFVSRTICHEGQHKKVLSYANQNLRSAIPDDKLSFGGDFKAYADYEKSDTADTKIFDAYVFVKDFPAELYAFKNDGGATYVKVNGQAHVLSTNEYYVDTLDLGLHHLEVFTGTSTKVNFNGFTLEAANAKNVIAEEPMVWKDGYCVLGTTGEEAAYSTAACTDFINLRGASKIVSFGKSRYSSDARMCFYDSDKNYLSYITHSQNLDGAGNFNVPQNAVYVKFNEKLEDKDFVTYFTDTFTNGFTNIDSKKFVTGKLPADNEYGWNVTGNSNGYFDVGIPVVPGQTLFVMNTHRFADPNSSAVGTQAYGYNGAGTMTGVITAHDTSGSGILVATIPEGVTSVKITATDTTYDKVWYKVR